MSNDITSRLTADYEAKLRERVWAWRSAVDEERQRCLRLVETIRTSPEWSGQHADWICGAIAEAIQQE